MRNLISELLDFRKQEQGYLKLRVEEQNLVTFTRQIYMCFYEYAQKKEITYRFDSVEETISVWFDPIQLQKVIFNLLSNAFKYTSNKGNITVEVRKVASQAVVQCVIRVLGFRLNIFRRYSTGSIRRIMPLLPLLLLWGQASDWRWQKEL